MIISQIELQDTVRSPSVSSLVQCCVCFLQYDIPTFVGTVEEETKDEIMQTDVPSEGITYYNHYHKDLRNNQ